MQTLYAGRAHTLIVGVARIAGTQYRFKLYQFNPATGYAPLQLEEVDKQLPILFKPMVPLCRKPIILHPMQITSITSPN